MRTPESIQIVLVEDNPDHAEMVRRVLRASGVTHVTWMTNGADALERLRRPADGRLPDLILLDINLPQISGLEILSRVKAHPFLRVVPVVMLTTSARPDDIRKAYRLGANSFVTKATDFQEFQEKLKSLQHYWLQISHLPEGHEAA